MFYCVFDVFCFCFIFIIIIIIIIIDVVVVIYGNIIITEHYVNFIYDCLNPCYTSAVPINRNADQGNPSSSNLAYPSTSLTERPNEPGCKDAVSGRSDKDRDTGVRPLENEAAGAVGGHPPSPVVGHDDAAFREKLKHMGKSKLISDTSYVNSVWLVMMFCYVHVIVAIMVYLKNALAMTLVHWKTDDLQAYKTVKIRKKLQE